jgi:hypothetical protein
MRSREVRITRSTRGAFGADARGRFAEQIEAHRELRQIVATLVGEHEAAREALEQRGVEVVLESPHLLADGCRRHAQLHGGRDEAAQPGRSLEGAQGIERGESPGHGRPRIT